MKPFSDYDQIDISRMKKLPAGGYQCKIMDVEILRTRNGKEYLRVYIDIIEGEYQNYYKNRWTNDTREDKKWGGFLNVFIPENDGSEKDGWTKRSFKFFIRNVEDSNNGYTWNWDENSLKYMKVGVLFKEEEWERGKFTTKPCSTLTIQEIKELDFEIPKTKYIDGSQQSPPSYTGEFISIADGIDEDIPFK